MILLLDHTLCYNWLLYRQCWLNGERLHRTHSFIIAIAINKKKRNWDPKKVHWCRNFWVFNHLVWAVYIDTSVIISVCVDNYQFHMKQDFIFVLSIHWINSRCCHNFWEYQKSFSHYIFFLQSWGRFFHQKYWSICWFIGKLTPK